MFTKAQLEKIQRIIHVEQVGIPPNYGDYFYYLKSIE